MSQKLIVKTIDPSLWNGFVGPDELQKPEVEKETLGEFDVDTHQALNHYIEKLYFDKYKRKPTDTISMVYRKATLLPFPINTLKSWKTSFDTIRELDELAKGLPREDTNHLLNQYGEMMDSDIKTLNKIGKAINEKETIAIIRIAE